MDLLRADATVGNWESGTAEWEECRLICLMQLPFNNFKCDWNSNWSPPAAPPYSPNNSLSLSCWLIESLGCYICTPIAEDDDELGNRFDEFSPWDSRKRSVFFLLDHVNTITRSLSYPWVDEGSVNLTKNGRWALKGCSAIKEITQRCSWRCAWI